MMRTRHYRAVLATSILATIPVFSGQAQQLDQPRDPPRQGPVQAPEQPGVRNRPAHVVMQVAAPGAHLEEGQLIRIIGPLDPTGDYIVMPIAAGPEAESRWLTGIYLAHLIQNTNFFVLTDVIARDSHEHEDETDHVILMTIHESDENGPTSVELWTDPHEGSLGMHGGSAHLTIF